MIKVTITKQHIDVRGHAPIQWCASVSTVLQMLCGMGRAIKWQESASDVRNHYIIRRRDDDLDRAAVEYLAALAVSGNRHVALAVHHDDRPAKRRRRRVKRKS